MQKSPEEIAFVVGYAGPMKFSEILGRLRPAPAPAEASAPPAPVLSRTEAEAALDALDVERAEVQAAIDAATARRRALLLRRDSDEEVLQLDRELDRLQLRAERCDVLEPEVLAAIADSQLAAEREHVGELREACLATVDALCQALTVAADLRGHLMRLRGQITGTELERHFAGFEMMPPNFPLDREMIARFEFGAKSALRAVRTTAPKPPVFAITFVRQTGPYGQGESAGFDAATAHHYVDTGAARWADGVRAPPTPGEAAAKPKPPARAWPRQVMPDEAPVQSTAPAEHDNGAAAEVVLETYDGPLIAADIETTDDVAPAPKRRPKQPAPNAGDAT